MILLLHGVRITERETRSRFTVKVMYACRTIQIQTVQRNRKKAAGSALRSGIMHIFSKMQQKK